MALTIAATAPPDTDDDRGFRGSIHQHTHPHIEDTLDWNLRFKSAQVDRGGKGKGKEKKKGEKRQRKREKRRKRKRRKKRK